MQRLLRKEAPPNLTTMKLQLLPFRIVACALSLFAATQIKAVETLYGSAGINGSDPGSIFIVNQSNGAGTFVGTPSSSLSGISFNGMGQMARPSAAWPSLVFSMGWECRQSDGVIFVTRGSTSNIFTLDPATGNQTLVGVTGLNSTASDLAFVPEPSRWALLIGGVCLLAGSTRGRRSRSAR